MPLKLRQYLYWSCGIHIVIFILFLLSPAFRWSSNRFKQDKVVWVSLPKGAANQLGSPMKKAEGLPKATIEEQKKALESPPSGQKTPQETRLMTYKQSQPEKKSPPKQEVPKRPGAPDSKVNDALARLKKEVAKKPAPQEAAQIPEGQPGGFTFGNTNGPYVAPNDPEYVMYQLKIRQRIMNEFILPMKFMEQNSGLICRIVVHINDRGEVVATEWEQKSGNPSYDLSAMRAVAKASPLDIPPERLKYEVLNEGFIIEFRPQAAQ